MEKVQNQLFLNYHRSNGRPFQTDLAGSNYYIPTGAVHVFPEMLVPGSSSADEDMLSALANSLYLEARSHNMSLAPYGHFDPVKIAIAGTFIGVLMANLLGDLSVIGKYSFSNVHFGKNLAHARDIELVSTEDDYANYCKRYNMLVAKVNSLYIPITGFARRWYEHRRNIYKDDEGDRFSLYTYYLQNYYEYIVDPSDTHVGRLVCRFMYHGWKTSNIATSFLNKLSLIESLVDKYLGDDDVANFCSEALNAGMPHMEFAPLKSVTHTVNGESLQQFVGPELKLVYDLDDIQGLENSCFVKPSFVNYVASGPSVALNWATWDIYEDVTTGRLNCGAVNGIPNKLPGFSQGTSVYSRSPNWGISKRPIFTHAKVTSLPGLTCLTRYIVATGATVVIPQTVSPSLTGYTYFNGVVHQTFSVGGFAVVPITVHGTELLCGHFSIQNSASGQEYTYATARTIQWYDATDVADVATELKLNLGFKARFVTYIYDLGDEEWDPDIADFDYVTSITDDALSTFFAANAWNDVMLISKMDSVPAETSEK